MRPRRHGLQLLAGHGTFVISVGLAVALASVAPLEAQTAGQAQEEPPERPPGPFGKSASIDVESEWAWADAGSRLLREPDFDSGLIAFVEVRTQVTVLERREDWLRVRYGSLTGWLSTVDAAASRTTVGAGSGSAPYVERARETFELRPEPESLGGFALYTNVTDEKILKALHRASRQLPSAYSRRYGFTAEPLVRETILLFADEADYRAFSQEDIEKTGPDLRGHATPEVAVLYVGDQSPKDVAAVLIHELTHLLNRRVFPTSIPPWLEEGLANDLAFCRIDSRGRARLGSLGGRGVVVEQSVYDSGGFIRINRKVNLTGAVASLRIVQERWRRDGALPLALLTDFFWREFTEAQDRDLRYSASAFFVRYLLDSNDPELAAGFRSFLRSVAAGDPSGPEQLARFLDHSLSELDTGFATWIAAQRLSG
jgi:hypothetical protein